MNFNNGKANSAFRTASSGGSVPGIARTLKIELLILIFGSFAIAGCVNYNDPTVTGFPGTTFGGRVENVAGYLVGMHPGKWPKKPDKNVRLKQCADILRSAVDTNQIELACGRLTNQPDVVLAIRTYSQQTISNLNEVASLLTNANLKTFTCDYGEGAEIVNPNNKNEWFDFIFYNNGPVMQIRKATIGNNHTELQMGFYQNGRLRGDSLGFSENGELDHCVINGTYLQIPTASIH